MVTPKSCSKCEKGQGKFFCVGCQAYFCKNCHEQHRDDMANQLEGFIENRNELQYQINEAAEEKNIDSPLLVEIEDWQRKTIEKVKKVAEQAKQQVIKLLNSKKTDVKSDFEKFSQELIQLKENADFLEDDSERLKQTVKQLKRKMEELSNQPEIELCKEQSDQIEWDTLIYIQEKTSFTAKRLRPEPPKGSEFDAAKKLKNCDGRACANCGKCRDWHYSGDPTTWRWIQNWANWRQSDWDRFLINVDI